MNFSLSNTSEATAITVNVPVPGGVMTGEIYTVSVTVSSETSLSNARTRKQWTSQDGSKNLIVSEKRTVGDSAQSFTKSEATPKRKTNTPLSHSGCWCNSSKMRVTDDDFNNAV